MMKQETFEWACLCAPLPFYKVAEPYMGSVMMSKEQAELVLREMNH